MHSMTVHVVPMEARRKCHICCDLGYRWLEISVRVLEFKPGSAGKAVDDFNHRAIFPAPYKILSIDVKTYLTFIINKFLMFT